MLSALRWMEHTQNVTLDHQKGSEFWPSSSLASGLKQGEGMGLTLGQAGIQSSLHSDGSSSRVWFRPSICDADRGNGSLFSVCLELSLFPTRKRDWFFVLVQQLSITYTNTLKVKNAVYLEVLVVPKQYWGFCDVILIHRVHGYKSHRYSDWFKPIHPCEKDLKCVQSKIKSLSFCCYIFSECSNLLCVLLLM